MKTLKDYKDWIDTYENPTESEKELIDGFKDILDEIFANHKNKLAEKDKLIRYYDAIYSQCCSEKLEILIKNQSLGNEIQLLKLKQLFKEDFYEYEEVEQITEKRVYLLDISKYDKLPSKDME